MSGEENDTKKRPRVENDGEDQDADEAPVVDSEPPNKQIRVEAEPSNGTGAEEIDSVNKNNISTSSGSDTLLPDYNQSEGSTQSNEKIENCVDNSQNEAVVTTTHNNNDKAASGEDTIDVSLDNNSSQQQQPQPADQASPPPIATMKTTTEEAITSVSSQPTPMSNNSSSESVQTAPASAPASKLLVEEASAAPQPPEPSPAGGAASTVTIETAPERLPPPPEALMAAAQTAPSSTTTTVSTTTATTTSVDSENQIIEEKGEISAEIAGRVIGKGGEVIRDLQARSGASIDVDAAPSGGNHRIVTYKGPRRKVNFAKHLVAMIARGMSDADLPLGEAVREILLIPASATGKVIGRGGEMVREMQTRSQAKIDFDHAATAHRPDQKQVVVTGTGEAVAKATEMIQFLVANPQVEAMQALNLLVNEKLASGTAWGSGPPYPNLPNAGQDMQPDMLGSYGSPGGFGPKTQYTTLPPQGQYGRQPDHRYGGSSGGMVEDMFYAKKQFMGRIIGQKGITINDLQKRSGADIQINQDVPPGQECEIRIRGTRDGVENAKQMLRHIIEAGPGHPFAGGAGGGPYSGGGAALASGAGGYSANPYGGAGGYDYSGQSYGYPAQQQGGYGYPAQGGGAGYGAPTQGGASYQSYGVGGGYATPAYAAASTPYGVAASVAPYGGTNYTPTPGGYQASYSQSGSYQQPAAPHMYGGGGAYGQPGPTSYPPVPAAPPAAPAAGWKAASSPDGQTYYYNELTGATQWEKPQGFAILYPGDLKGNGAFDGDNVTGHHMKGPHF